MNPEIPILVYDDEWLTRSFSMRQMKAGITVPRGTKITEENLEEFTDPYDLTNKRIVCTVRTGKPSSSFVPLVADSDLFGINILSPANGRWQFAIDTALLQRLVGKADLFYSIVVYSNGIPDRAWSGTFEVLRR